MNINFKFSIGHKVIDETRNVPHPGKLAVPSWGHVKTAGWDGKRAYYCVEAPCGRRWTAHENAITDFEEFGRRIKETPTDSGKGSA